MLTCASLLGRKSDVMPELGNKHTCYSCQTKFYDLGRDPICPKCSADQRDGDSETTGRRTARKSRKASPKKKVVVEEPDDDTDDDADAEDSDDEDEDDDLAVAEVGKGAPVFGDDDIDDDD